MEINGVKIGPGQRKVIGLEIERLPSHTLIDMPVHVYRGHEPGPVLLITATMHGDEINGAETIRRMARNNSLVPVIGTVITIPIVNIYGFINQSRTLPDGKDLNRSFPGSKRGSLARRLANTVMTKIVPNADYIIDLHTGGASRTNYPQIRCNFDRPEIYELGKAVRAPFLVHSKEIPGSFRKAVSNINKPILVYEGGESLRLDENAIWGAVKIIKRMMTYLGMIYQESEGSPSIEIRDRKWIRARGSGLFVPFVSYGKHVAKSEVLAHLGDPYGHKIHEVRAPDNGYIIGLNNQPIVNAGDALIHFGKH